MALASLDLLTAFAAVAERGGFTAAGRALSVSKATVSKQVAELERRLGVALFHRTTRRLSLTEAGQRTLARVQRIAAEAELIFEEAGEARDVPRGRLRLTAPLTLAQRHLAEALPDFLRAYPDIQLELTLDDRRIDLVGEGMDAALRISEMEDSALTARRLAPVRLHLVAAPGYWAAHGKPAHPADLTRHACFRYANLPTGSVWRFIGPDGTETRVTVDGPLCVNNGDVELPALRAGLGLARLPDVNIWQDLAAGRLETALEAWRGPELTLAFLTPPGRSAPRKVRALSDFLHARFGAGRAPWLAAPG